MPLLKGRSSKTISKNISEFHKGPTYAHTLAKFGKKRANKQAIAVALNTARKYQAGGEVEESQDRLMKTAEGFPFVQAGETIQPPGSGLYNLGKQVVGGMQEHVAAPGQIKSNEGPPVYSTTPPATASPETGREILHELNPLRWFDQPPVKDLPPDAYKGKIEPNQPDWIAPVAAGLEAGSNLIGLPSLFGAGVSKAAIAFGAKMATQQAAKQAPKVAAPVAAKIHQEMAGLPGFLDTSGFKQAGHQLGFHAGGVYAAPDGTQYYLKVGTDIGNVMNEQLGAKLYALAGTPVAEVGITSLNGKPGIASKFLPNAHQLSETKLPYKDIPGLHDNFVVDAWLANHDAVGTGGENPLGNIMISNGRAVRIDTGGSLRYKGSGDLKKHFYDEADEIDSMRSYDFSKRSADVFHDVSPEAMKAGAQKVADVDPRQLAKIIAEFGPADKTEAQKLYNRLLKRREYIMEKLGVRPSWEKPAVPAAAADEPLDPLTAEAWAALEKELVGYNPSRPRGKTLDQIESEAESPFEVMPPASSLPRDDPITAATYGKGWAKKLADEEQAYENSMVGEKDFSQGPLPPETLKTPEEWEALDKTSRAVKAIKPDTKPLSLGKVMQDEKPLLESTKQAFLDTATSKKLSPPQLNKLWDVDVLSKKEAKQIATALHSGPDHPGKSFETAAHLWNVAEKVTAHKAEALFRALPEDSQKMVGRRIAALKKAIGYSPFDTISGETGKFLTSHTSLHNVPEHLWTDPVFTKQLSKAVDSLGAKSATKPEKVDVSPKDAANTLIHASPSSAANQLVDLYGDDIGKIANVMYRMADKKPQFVDNVYTKLPWELAPGVNGELQTLINKHGDPWKSAPWVPKTAEDHDIVNALKQIKDWQNYVPKETNFQKPKFPSPWTRKRAESTGHNVNLLLWKGHSKPYDYPEEIKDFSLKTDWGGKNFFERANFLTHRQDVAPQYGPKSTPYVARGNKVLEVDYEDLFGQSSYFQVEKGVHRIIEAARSQGADMVLIHNIEDYGPHGNHTKQTQYAVLNQEILRAPHAKFDPTKLHLARPLLGLVGGGLMAYGTLKGEDNKMRRGGSITTALRAAKKYASGGPGSAPWNVRNSSHIPHGPGMIQSSIPGRTDKLPLSVKSGSFILPADIPSALGEGNTMAGGKILSKMLESGPLGTKPLTPPRVKKTKFPSLGRFRKPKAKGFAEGGESEEVPIIAAGGEWIVDPEQVAGVGGGDLDKGHKVLKNFVLDVRRKNIKTLRKLKEPKMS